MGEHIVKIRAVFFDMSEIFCKFLSMIKKDFHVQNGGIVDGKNQRSLF